MTAGGIHPGFTALAAVAGLTAILLITQTRERQPVTQAVRATTAQTQEQLTRQPTTTSPLAGIARVIDGDTIDIRGNRIRLDGIDAPESKQTCELNGQSYPCGQRATEAMVMLLGARPIECSEMGKDRNGRVIARCRVDTSDVGTWMVEHGWAVAYRKYSLEYVSAENRARAAKLGIWAGTFDMPEDWRRQKAMGKAHVQQ